jgi:hypothetical protein
LDTRGAIHRGKGHRCFSRPGRQGALQRVKHELMHRARVPKANLCLRRVHVHVHAAWIDLEEQHVRGLALAVQELRIRFAHRVREQAIAHEAAIHEEVLPTFGLRRSGSPVQPQRTTPCFNRDAARRE